MLQGLRQDAIGLASQHTGAGRATKEDTIDLSAGIYVHKKVTLAMRISKGDILRPLFYGNDAAKLDNAIGRGTAKPLRSRRKRLKDRS